MPLIVILAVRVLGVPAARYVVSQEGAITASRILVSSKAAWELLTREDTSDAELSLALSDLTGYNLTVATFTGNFELRRAQLSWSQADAAVATDDVRVATFDLIKLSGSTPVDTWAPADFTALQNAITTFWNGIKNGYTSRVSLVRLKVYKLGPNITPPQYPVYDAALSLPGTSSSTVQLPPQVAISVTEKAGQKLHWGRFYLPSPGATGLVDSYGRILPAALTQFADAADTMYESLRTAGIPVVVYRRPLDERKKKNGVTLPARPASAWTVDDIQIDDVFDVIRSRRFKTPLLRVQRQIG